MQPGSAPWATAAACASQWTACRLMTRSLAPGAPTHTETESLAGPLSAIDYLVSSLTASHASAENLPCSAQTQPLLIRPDSVTCFSAMRALHAAGSLWCCARLVVRAGQMGPLAAQRSPLSRSPSCSRRAGPAARSTTPTSPSEYHAPSRRAPLKQT